MLAGCPSASVPKHSSVWGEQWDLGRDECSGTWLAGSLENLQPRSYLTHTHTCIHIGACFICCLFTCLCARVVQRRTIFTKTTITHQIVGCNLSLYSGPLPGWEETRLFSFFFQAGWGGGWLLWVSSIVTLFVSGWKEGRKEGLASGWRGTEARGWGVADSLACFLYYLLDFSTLLHIVSISSANNARLLNWCCQDGFYVVYLIYLPAFNLHLVSTSSCSACHGCE